MEGGSPTRGGLRTVDITTFFPTIKMLAINEADNLLYYWNLSSWGAVSIGGGTSVPKIIPDLTYTLNQSDVNNVYTNAGGCAVTIPAGISLSHSSYHTSVTSGNVSFIGDGTTINNANGDNASNGQYAVATLFQTSQDNFILGGNTQTV